MRLKTNKPEDPAGCQLEDDRRIWWSVCEGSLWRCRILPGHRRCSARRVFTLGVVRWKRAESGAKKGGE